MRSEHGNFAVEAAFYVTEIFRLFSISNLLI
jgi:hypothetical protein